MCSAGQNGAVLFLFVMQVSSRHVSISFFVGSFFPLFDCGYFCHTDYWPGLRRS